MTASRHVKEIVFECECGNNITVECSQRKAIEFCHLQRMCLLCGGQMIHRFIFNDNDHNQTDKEGNDYGYERIYRHH